MITRLRSEAPMTTTTQPMADELLALAASSFRLLADPTRLRLILALRQAELGVSAIAEAAGTSQANASKHLTALHSAGMIARRRDGGSVYYRANGREPYLPIDAVSTSLDAQTIERQPLLSSAQQTSTTRAA
jgi:DNA-binding transcriptional ArsR family regulator